MYVFRNVNDGFSGMLRQIENGDIESRWTNSRNGRCLTSIFPQMWMYYAPTERVLFNRARDANPFFHLYEAMWMLSGSNKLEQLVHYCKQMAEYSDDGKTINDAYGYRWAFHFDVDQLADVSRLLIRDRNTRRAVIGMWDPRRDLEASLKNPASKAVPCNTHCYFRVQDGRLCMTVCNRSNDLVWGAFGANAVHFSFLLEYVALLSGLEVGHQIHMSNDLHMYEANMKIEAWLADNTPNEYVLYPHKYIPLWSDEGDRSHFHHELANFVNEPTRSRLNSFLGRVAVPLMCAWEDHKARDYDAALRHVAMCEAADWFCAASNWLEKRKRNWETDDK